MATAGTLAETLKSITTAKINELSKQWILFDKRECEILADADDAPDLRARARTLLDGVSRLKGYPMDALDEDDMDLNVDSSADNSDLEMTSPGVGQLQAADLTNIRRFLLQGKYDASVTKATLCEWIALFEKELRYLELKHELASFYSELVTEWLTHLDEKTKSLAEDQADDTKSNKSDTGFENVDRAEIQRAKWESLVFTAATHVGKRSIRAYLDDLFTKSKLSLQALKELREDIQNFANDLVSQGKWLDFGELHWASTRLDVGELQWVSNELMKSDLLSNEKATILEELMRNTEAAQEVADVLNMRLKSLDSWGWGGDGIPIEMRCQLNGKYRVYTDEDLLDSLLLQYLGSKWAFKLRDVFTKFLRSHAWSPMLDDVPNEYKDMHKYFLGNSYHHWNSSWSNDAITQG